MDIKQVLICFHNKWSFSIIPKMKKNLGWKEIFDQNIWKYDFSLNSFFFQFWLVLKYLELIYFLKLKRTLYFSNPSSIVSSLQEGRQTGWLAGWQSGRLARQAVGLAGKQAASRQKSDNLEYNTMERWIDGLIIPPLDGPMFILIERE